MKTLFTIAFALLLLTGSPAEAQVTDLGFSHCYANGPWANCSTPDEAIDFATPMMEENAGCKPGDGLPCVLIQGRKYDFHLFFKYMRNPGIYPGTVTCTAFFVPENDLHFVTWSNCALTGGLCTIEGHFTGLE